MRVKKEFGFEHNATESRFVANHKSEFLTLIYLLKRGDEVCKKPKQHKEYKKLIHKKELKVFVISL